MTCIGAKQIIVKTTLLRLLLSKVIDVFIIKFSGLLCQIIVQVCLVFQHMVVQMILLLWS